jgi:hypothetical protein
MVAAEHEDLQRWGRALSVPLDLGTQIEVAERIALQTATCPECGEIIFTTYEEGTLIWYTRESFTRHPSIAIIVEMDIQDEIGEPPDSVPDEEA